MANEALELREPIEESAKQALDAIGTAFTALSGTLVPMEIGRGRRKHQRSGWFLNSYEKRYLSVLEKKLGWKKKDFARVVAYLKEAPDTRGYEEGEVRKLITHYGSEEAFAEAPRAVAEAFWKNKKKQPVKNMLARIALHPNALDPAKDAERGIDTTTLTGVSMEGESREIESLLCQLGEGNMIRATKSNTGVLVNKVIFFKTGENGRPVGLCVRDVRLPNGQVFLAGMFYNADPDTRGKLERQEYDTRKGATGIRQIDMPRSVWNPVRAIRDRRKIGKEAWGAVTKQVKEKN